MPDVSSPRVRAYLDELDRALRDLPRERRSEIVSDIRAHIDDALAAAEKPSEAVVAAILDDLGTPQEIAEAAYAEMPAARTRIAGRDIATVVLLLVGGVVLPLVGWVIGVVLLWSSSSWRTKDKVIGTLVVPGGLLATLLFVFVGVFAATSCESSGSSTGAVSSSCTGGPGAATRVLGLLVLAFVVIGPFFGMVWLLRKARRVA